MTLESRLNENRFIGNGSTKLFPFTFRVWKTNQVQVFVGDGDSDTDATGLCTVTVTASGGTVEFSSPPDEGTVIVIARNMPYIQEDDYKNGTRFDAEEIEDRLDQDCAERQDLLSRVDRALTVPVTSSKKPEDFWAELREWRNGVLEALETAGDVTGATMVAVPGTGTARMLQDRFGDIVNVKDYGARGDGVITSITATPKPLVIVVAGQSNAVGFAPTTDTTYSLSGCKFWNGENGAWQSPVVNPVWNSSTSGFLPALASLINSQKLRPVYFINVAVGNTICAIQNTVPHAGTWAATGSLRARAKGLVTAALEAIDVPYDMLGTVWLQGESDAADIASGRETLEDYASTLADTIAWFLNGENVGGDFFAVSIAYSAYTASDSSVDTVNGTIETTVAGIAKAHMVSDMPKTFRADGYLADAWHYTAKAYNMLGRSIALGLNAYIEPNVKTYSGTFSGTDDTDAWNRWQAALADGGIGYVPAGVYLVSGWALAFKDGCFGNCMQWKMPGNAAPNDMYFISDASKTGPILQHHRDFYGIESWSPLIDLSFDSVSDRTWPWTANGAGAQGIQVRGTLRGTGNSHPSGIRSLMFNELNGDGDCVALWGRCHKSDPDGGTNNSDTCAIHAMCEVSGEGLGICMATEHWARCMKPQGTAGTRHASFFDPGGIVCQHVLPFGMMGMVQSCILINHGGGDYGAWSAININNNVCKYNGSTQYPQGTAFIKSPNTNPNASPNHFILAGWCPKHFTVFGGYNFNVFANWMIKHNNVADQDSIIAIADQRFSDSDETKTPMTGLKLISSSYGGIAHAQNVNATRTTLFDLYNIRGNVNTFYRAQNQGSTHHVFYATDSSENLVEVFNIFYNTVRPGWSGQQLGDGDKRWSQLFAQTGTINTSDERVKDNIESPSEQLMRAWGKVGFKVFQMKDAIEAKGEEAARLHVGVIAQQVISAFAEEGLDATRYGLLCHDEWEAEEPKIQRHWIVDEMEKRDDDGNVIEEEKGHYEEFVESPGREAGDIYSIRYDEALSLECAYQRWRLNRIETALNMED